MGPAEGIFRVLKYACALTVKGFLLVSLIGCSLFVCSCSKNDKETKKASQSIPQQFAGTLPIRILPEAPTAAGDLQAVINSGNGVTCTWLKNGVVLENENNFRLSRSRFAKHDIIMVVVQRGNEKGSATVVIGNALPKVTSISTVPAVICGGVDITATAVASDPDGDQVVFDYTWNVNGKDLPEKNPMLKGDMFKKGDRVSLVVVPSDGEGVGPAYTRVMTVPDASPVFTSTPPTAFKGTIYTYHAVAVDPDGDSITYSLGSAPRGMTIDAKTGMITWQLKPEDIGTHMIEITAQDPDGAVTTQRYSLTIK
jgi:hypothetical protein